MYTLCGALNLLAWQADDPLDEIALGLFGILEDDDVPLLISFIGSRVRSTP